MELSLVLGRLGNPGESAIREGLFARRWPAAFPSGQGSDFAGVVEKVGQGVTSIAVGDEVIGFTNNRASQAEFVLADAQHLGPARMYPGSRQEHYLSPGARRLPRSGP